jgi:AraC-like DNA-binding protein
MTALKPVAEEPALTARLPGPAAGWSGPQRLAFSTADPLRAREFLDDTYGGRLLVASACNGGMALAVSHVDAGSFALSDLTLAADLTFTVTGRDAVVISTVIEGTAEADRAEGTERYRPGDVLIGNFPQAEYVGRTHNLRRQALILPVSLLYAVAGTEPTPSGPMRFLSLHPVGAAARAQWRNTSQYAGSVLANPDAAASRLIIPSTARLLAATALAVFPNTALTDPVAQDRRDASSATLRRAIAFIHEHAEEDISVVDIAAAARVSTRAVQLAFRRHCDTTPLAYLRRVRLARAHYELLAADPERESVTSVAYRWGFSSPSRFAAAYSQAFGVLPSHTLRQRLAAGGQGPGGDLRLTGEQRSPPAVWRRVSRAGADPG